MWLWSLAAIHPHAIIRNENTQQEMEEMKKAHRNELEMQMPFAGQVISVCIVLAMNLPIIRSSIDSKMSRCEEEEERKKN